MKISINNAIALLEEAVTNGENSPYHLYTWLVSERGLIETTIQELRDIEKELREEE